MAKLSKTLDIEIIRVSPDYDIPEGIGFLRDYNSILNYEISIPKRSFPLGQVIPIDIKLVPLIKKLKIRGKNIKLIEKTTYVAKGNSVTVPKIVSTHEINDLMREYILEDNNDNTNYHNHFDFPIPNCKSKSIIQ